MISIWEILFLLFGGALLVWLFLTLIYGLWAMARLKVPCVSSSRKVAKKLISVAKLKSGDRVFDLGSGYGSLLFAAAKENPKVKATGYELLLPAVWHSRLKSWLYNLALVFVWKDFFQHKKIIAQKADVIFLYLMPCVVLRFEKEIWPLLKPKTRVVVRAFALPNIKPQDTIDFPPTKIFIYTK